MKSFDMLMEMGKGSRGEKGERMVSVKRGRAEPGLKYDPGRNNITPQTPCFSGASFLYFSN